MEAAMPDDVAFPSKKPRRQKRRILSATTSKRWRRRRAAVWTTSMTWRRDSRSALCHQPDSEPLRREGHHQRLRSIQLRYRKTPRWSSGTGCWRPSWRTDRALASAASRS